MAILDKLLTFDYKTHLFVGFLVRLALIAFGVYYDQVSSVPYTDIDYKVFTDASRHVLDGRSPYNRHTYRYSPLVAILLTSNILFHPTFGKILFSVVDLIIALLIRAIVKHSMHVFGVFSSDTVPNRLVGRNRNKRSKSVRQMEDTSMLNASLIAWLYNPFIIAISTRGSCDSLAVFLVLVTLYLLQCKKMHFASGLMHGLSIHFRLYPIIYSLSFYMHLSTFAFYSADYRFRNELKSRNELNNRNELVAKVTTKKTIFKKEYLWYLLPNYNQMKLVAGCLLSLGVLTGLFYYLYGYQFLFETYFFHLKRVDFRHNFSLYFYLQYLSAWVKNVGVWQKVLMVLPQIVLLVVFSIRYGLNQLSLNFSVLTQTIVLVIYNSVLTSQYFVWILAILPVCLWQIKISVRNAVILLLIWFAAQVAWLMPAYCLEYHGQNTFVFIWLQSVSFFCANIAILGRLIMYFMPISSKKLV